MVHECADGPVLPFEGGLSGGDAKRRRKVAQVTTGGCKGGFGSDHVVRWRTHASSRWQSRSTYQRLQWGGERGGCETKTPRSSSVDDSHVACMCVADGLPRRLGQVTGCESDTPLSAAAYSPVRAQKKLPHCTIGRTSNPGLEVEVVRTNLSPAANGESPLRTCPPATHAGPVVPGVVNCRGPKACAGPLRAPPSP